jgi:hypothetical protein
MTQPHMLERYLKMARSQRPSDHEALLMMLSGVIPRAPGIDPTTADDRLAIYRALLSNPAFRGFDGLQGLDGAEIGDAFLDEEPWEAWEARAESASDVEDARAIVRVLSCVGRTTKPLGPEFSVRWKTLGPKVGAVVEKLARSGATDLGYWEEVFGNSGFFLTVLITHGFVRFGGALDPERLFRRFGHGYAATSKLIENCVLSEEFDISWLLDGSVTEQAPFLMKRPEALAWILAWPGEVAGTASLYEGIRWRVDQAVLYSGNILRHGERLTLLRDRWIMLRHMLVAMGRPWADADTPEFDAPAEVWEKYARRQKPALVVPRKVIARRDQSPVSDLWSPGNPAGYPPLEHLAILHRGLAALRTAGYDIGPAGTITESLYGQLPAVSRQM